MYLFATPDMYYRQYLNFTFNLSGKKEKMTGDEKKNS